jgi:methyl-accepting chemotaxis protein
VATHIAAAVEEQGMATQAIVRNVTDAIAGAGEVMTTVAQVAEAARETGTTAQQVSGSASELSLHVEHRRGGVTRFLASARAA